MSLSLRDPVRTLQRDLSRLLLAGADELGDGAVPLTIRVHETRKRLKQARAWARLLSLDIDKELRTLHRRLGARRDDDALLAALASLQAMADLPALSALQQLQHGVQPDDAIVAADAVAADLRRLAASLPETAGDFELLLDGIVRTARKSRRALRRAVASGDARDFHRWRKWIKYLAFQLRYVESLSPRTLRGQAAAAAQAAEWLGEAHDLELVRGRIAQVPLAAAARKALLALVDREQQARHEQATRSGLALHAESPRELGRRLAGYREALARPE